MRIIWVNTAVQKHLGLSNEQLKGERCFELIQGIKEPCPDCTALKALQTGISQEGEVVTPDGRTWLSCSSPLMDANETITGVVNVAMNISGRKKTEDALKESERRLASIIDFLPDATLVIDKEGRVIAWNKAIEVMTGVKAEDILGKGDYEYALPFYSERKPILVDLVLKPLDEIEKRYSDIERVDGTLAGYTFGSSLKGGGAYLWGVAGPLHDTKGNVVGAIESFKDITDKKHQEEMNQASLKEKDLLLREIHHRVKNNLQIISSLLSIQGRCIQDENTQNVLVDCQNRVKSMALVHANLYRSEDLSKVDFANYIRRLTKFLFSSFGVNKNRVRLNLDLDKVSLEIDKAIPCGLIINELVTNCLKHAFPEGRTGEILIVLHSLNGMVALAIRDNGIGLPASGFISSQDSRSLGFKLVDSLVKQLKGTIETNLSKGTEFRITFPIG
jgi:PAS domain S-box-containing protein